MFRHIQWLEADIWLVIQGLAGLGVIVIAGVVLAEAALNDLTRHAEFVQFFNVGISKMSEYSFYFLGDNFKLRAVTEIGKISTEGRNLVLELGGGRIAINTLPTVDLQSILHLLGTWMATLKNGVMLLLSDAWAWLYNEIKQLWTLL